MGVILKQEDIDLVASMVGRTTVAAEWGDLSPTGDWTAHEYARLTLDDGRTVMFSAWGYDAWGAVVSGEDAQ